MPEEIKFIQPAPAVRDEMGWFQHPHMPDFDEGDGDKCKAWVAEQGLKLMMVSLEYADEAVADRYFESGDPDYSYWEPDRPEGEDWFCLAIHDTEDGPVCWWASRKGRHDLRPALHGRPHLQGAVAMTKQITSHSAIASSS